MKRLFKVLFFVCGWIGLLLNVVFVASSYARVPIATSAIEIALEISWVGGVTFFGLGALILDG